MYHENNPKEIVLWLRLHLACHAAGERGASCLFGRRPAGAVEREQLFQHIDAAAQLAAVIRIADHHPLGIGQRSEERRVGKECS